MVLTRKEFKKELTKKIISKTANSIILNNSHSNGFQLKYHSNTNYNFMLFFQHKKEGIFLNIKPTGEVYFRVKLLEPHTIDTINESKMLLMIPKEKYTKDELYQVFHEFDVLYKKYTSYLLRGDK
ncbi:hypothetical protein [Virgibacillus sp.]|uniref:hypothetical protein n=1 Tax=Virgibacillus sp. TaxID=1872700 RepID=UPI00183D362F|nr:hypothetical protein [Virgibacillus sp.]NWO12695.1 hypothetical protein [Virgibacillus sp.]